MGQATYAERAPVSLAPCIARRLEERLDFVSPKNSARAGCRCQKSANFRRYTASQIVGRSSAINGRKTSEQYRSKAAA